MWNRMTIPAIAVFLAVGCGEGGPPVSPDTVARAGDLTLSADEAAAMLAPQRQLPARPEVVEALADLWIDYALLGLTAAEDSTLSGIDLSPVLSEQLQQEVLLALRDRVVQVDTTISDEELRRLYTEQLPGARLRARHILLSIPSGATPEQVDSVRAFARSLRERIVAGESFESIAREYSQDPGSAASGGDLGTFGRGEMVRPFEEAAFALEPGEVSEPVETPFGFHLIRVDERVIPSFEEAREGFRSDVVGRRVTEAESTYVAGLMETAEIQVQEDAYEPVRQLSADPGAHLGRRARNRALVRYEGGAFTLGEYQAWIRARSPGIRSEIQQATDPQLERLLENLARTELLVRAAEEEGIEVSPERQDSLREVAREGLLQAARELGLVPVVVEEGESPKEAVQRQVGALLREIVMGTRSVVPLGPVAFTLREARGAEIYPSGVQEAVARTEALRNSAPPPPPAAPTPPDTGAGAGNPPVGGG